MPQATQSATPLAVGCDQSELHVLCSILPVRGGRSPLPLIFAALQSIMRSSLRSNGRYSFRQSEKGKPPERVGRKAEGP